MIREMKKRRLSKMKYSITVAETRMTVGVEYETWVGVDDDGDAVVEFRSRDLGEDFRGPSYQPVYEQMLDAVRERNGTDAKEAGEEVLQRF